VLWEGNYAIFEVDCKRIHFKDYCKKLGKHINWMAFAKKPNKNQQSKNFKRMATMEV